jgi:ADP-heptose:LPS heptosyltransferase
VTGRPDGGGPATARRSVVVYRALGLGDFLTGVPAYRAVRRAYPDARVELAAPAVLEPLAALSGAFDRLVPTPELTTPRLAVRPDVVANLHGRGPQSHRALLPLAAAEVVAFRCVDPPVEGPDWCPDEHEVVRWCRLLEESGIAADPTDLDLPTPGSPSVHPGATVIHPGAAHPARRWPAERFAEVARHLAALGHRVVVTGSAGERHLTEAVVAAADLPDVAALGGRLDLGRLAALVAGASLVVCGDTGVAHLATAFGTPSVLLFGPMSPDLWGPPVDRPQHRVLWHPEADPALLAIEPDEVIALAATAARA